jgi:hypothetical protein
MTLRIGVTGQREQLTATQIQLLWKTLTRINLRAENAGELVTLHHGDCSGADNTANTLATVLRWKRESHPATGLPEKYSAQCDVDIRHDPKPPLDRNQDIVAAAEELIALPLKSETEATRSGTWATVRRARKKRIVITLIYPDGRIVREEPIREPAN